ncbi:hypothetical protein [Psychrobacillus sp. OK032]|uniref:hypothetical protein n=1 Tax=Psychrobacillus sp. OK032 TaxID=1884358 RepID=UPI0008C002D6|nr:hypothetical protein [Psychrobacillus sp. OK032]SES17783.1 hypothetical protein SAMN05518872_105123 [Psychrobacillus sp. OK032]
MDLDFVLMMELAEVDLILKELEEGYRKKYFRKDATKPWGFKCYYCEKKVASNEADEFWCVPDTSYGSSGIGRRRFCSRDCSDCYFNEQRNELLEQRKRIMEDRKLLRVFYKEAEREFKEIISAANESYST